MSTEKCIICQTEDMIVKYTHDCGHSETICVDCLPDDNKITKCKNCISSSQKKISCGNCNKGLADLTINECQTFKFSNCKKDCDPLYYCKDCIVKYYKERHNQTTKRCYHCNINLQDTNIQNFTHQQKVVKLKKLRKGIRSVYVKIVRKYTKLQIQYVSFVKIFV